MLPSVVEVIGLPLDFGTVGDLCRLPLVWSVGGRSVLHHGAERETEQNSGSVLRHLVEAFGYQFPWGIEPVELVSPVCVEGVPLGETIVSPGAESFYLPVASVGKKIELGKLVVVLADLVKCVSVQLVVFLGLCSKPPPGAWQNLQITGMSKLFCRAKRPGLWEVGSMESGSTRLQ